MPEHQIIPRSEWGARYRGGWGLRDLPATEAWLHHPAMTAPGPDATLAQDVAHVLAVEKVGYDRFGPHTGTGWGTDAGGEYGAGISYTLLVMQSGRIFEGHDIRRASSHTAGHNTPGVGIALAGNFTGTAQPTRAQLEAAAWGLTELVRRGHLAQARLDGGHRDVFATTCPGNAYAHLGTINALAGGEDMARRPTRTDMRRVEAEFRRRGIPIYCGPSHYDSGACAPGKHPHASDSRHFHGLALDFGWGAAPINDTEALVVELIMNVYLPRWFPELRFRKLWNVGPGNHQDHGHLDDNADAWVSVVTPRPGVLARDGVDLFVPVSAIPEHIPPGNHNLPLGHVAQVQTLLGTKADGYHGPTTTSLVRAAQTRLGITADGMGGLGTLAALLKAAKPVPPVVEPKPPVVEKPKPPLQDTPDRLYGADRYATFAAVALAAPKERQAKVYLIAHDLIDGPAAAAAGDGVLLLVARGQDTLRSSTSGALATMRPTTIVPVGSTTVITTAAYHAARTAAGL